MHGSATLVIEARRALHQPALNVRLRYQLLEFDVDKFFSNHDNNFLPFNRFGSFNTQQARTLPTEHGPTGNHWPLAATIHPNLHEQVPVNPPSANFYGASTSSEVVH
jgi:hypothetical protein